MPRKPDSETVGSQTPESAPPSDTAASLSSARGSISEGGVLPQVPPDLVQNRQLTDAGDVVRGRDDNDALTGQFAVIVAGEHSGRRVVVGSTVALAEDGYPERVLVRTRDGRDELLEVDYEILEPSPAGGRI